MSERLLAIGAPYDTPSRQSEDAGSVHILSRNGNKLELSQEFDGDEFDEFGVSVALSKGRKNGGESLDIVIMGSDRHSSKDGKMNIGMAKVFYFSNIRQDWQQMGQDIVGQWEGEYLGQNVAISNDGMVIAVATSIGDELRRGRVDMFHYDDISNNWDKMGFSIEGEKEGDKFGFSVSIAQVDSSNNDPGNYFVAIGAPEANKMRGKVKVFNYDKDGGGWDQVGRDIDGDESQDQMGFDVSMAKNGDHLYLAIGIPSSNLETDGRVQVLKFNTDLDETEWIYFGDEIEQHSVNDGTGQVVELSTDGMILAVGAPEHMNGKGMVRVYEWNWDYGDYVRAGDSIEGEEDDAFGSCISISGNEIAIGAPYGGYVEVFAFDPNGEPALGSAKSKSKSGSSGFGKFIIATLSLGVVAFLVLTLYKKMQSKGFKCSSFVAALPGISLVRRRGREAVDTEDQRDQWPFPFFSPSDRARIDEVRKAEEGRADEDVDSVVLHGMPSCKSVSSEDVDSSSESDDADDDVSYDSLGKNDRGRVKKQIT